MFTNLSDACCEAKRWKHLLNLTWLYTKACQTFSGTFSGTLLNLTWLCTKSLPDLLRNLLQNPVELDLALHQSLPDLLQKLLGTLTFSRTFSGTLLNLTWLCTKASQTFTGTFSGTLLEPSREPY